MFWNGEPPSDTRRVTLHEPHKTWGELMCSGMVNPLVTPVVLLLHEPHKP